MFPLLKKELIEQANRKRAYWMRGIYASLLISIFLLGLIQINREFQGPLGMMGKEKSILVG